MITPAQANGLKPGEVLWLREAEKVVDQALLEEFATTGEVWVKIQKPPFPRTMLVFEQHYGLAGWNTRYFFGQDLIDISFSPREAVMNPKFPAAGVEAVVTEVTETAWDKIRMDE